jgi:hypothetical protein
MHAFAHPFAYPSLHFMAFGGKNKPYLTATAFNRFRRAGIEEDL